MEGFREEEREQGIFKRNLEIEDIEEVTGLSKEENS